PASRRPATIAAWPQRPSRANGPAPRPPVRQVVDSHRETEMHRANVPALLPAAIKLVLRDNRAVQARQREPGRARPGHVRAVLRATWACGDPGPWLAFCQAVSGHRHY